MSDPDKPWYRDGDFVSEAAATIVVGLVLLLIVGFAIIGLLMLAKAVLL